MRYFAKLLIIWIVLLNFSCAGLPKAPKLDIGILDIKEKEPGKYVLRALFQNQSQTEWVEGVEDLAKYRHKHYIFRGDQLIDMMVWLDKVMIVLKQELTKRK